MMGSGVATGEDRAEEAAEIAISSPLLEDIDLAGARGVLVNITAGLDMRLEEFETVGNTVKAFASDNATVVIGTSLDPDMSDEIRVTVVATGIGNSHQPDITLVKGGSAKAVSTPQSATQAPAQPAAKSEEEAPQPMLRTNKAPATSSSSSASNENSNTVKKPDENDSGYLDIPAFLRHQAD